MQSLDVGQYTRSLGVIFLSDIVGYSKMMAQDEAGKLALLRSFSKNVVKPTLDKHSGIQKVTAFNLKSS